MSFDDAALRKHWTAAVAGPIASLRRELEAVGTWREPELERAFEAVRAAHGEIPLGKLAQPVRVAVTGSAASPGIFETLRAVGRARTLARLDRLLAQPPAG